MDVAGTLRAAIVPAIIAILLSPGLLFNIPPINGKWWMTGQTNLTNVIVHGLLIGIVLVVLSQSGRVSLG